MEYVEGVPLKGPLPVAKSMEYAGQILDAQAAAHRKGITHRDLKPANIPGGWIVSRFLHQSAEAQVHHLEIDPPEGSRFTFGNNIGGLALSPDGRTAAHVTWGGGKNGLWLRPPDRPGSSDIWLIEVERGVAGRLTSNPGFSTYPIWSPDCRTILFSSGAPRNLYRKESSGAENEQRFSRLPRA
jgi:hypothetical protein